MTDSASSPAVRDLPDDLPPVKPPSMVFIFQLFVVPALIVAAVVAVWVLFGKLASGEQDWESLVVEIGSPNPQIRYRAMMGLAQVLDSDRRRGAEGQHLSQNSRIAQALADELTNRLASSTRSKDALNDVVYLTRALGSIDHIDLAIPPLLQALNADWSIDTHGDIRKSGIISVALIAGRALDINAPLQSPEISQAVIDFSMDRDADLRRAGAFTLGLIDTPESLNRLEVLLEDNDWMTDVNAAIALARRGSTKGFPVLKAAVSGKAAEKADGSAEDSASELAILRNVLKAIGDLSQKWSAEQQAELKALVSKLAETHAEARVRADANETLTHF